MTDPKLGIIVPNLGINNAFIMTTIANALFTKTQQKVLGLLYGQPEKSFYTNDILRRSDIGRGTVSRELERLTDAGLITMTRTGNQCHYQANSASPVFSELVGIIKKTVGLLDVISDSLLVVAEQIKVAFIYGSIAKNEETASSDVDVMVVSNTLSYTGLVELLSKAENSISRPINPTLYTEKEIKTKMRAQNAFVTRVFSQSKLWIVGTDLDLKQFRKPGKN